MNIQLSLKRKWFDMTKKGVKTEDYREITPYWIKRLTFNDINLSEEEINYALCSFRDGYTAEEVYQIHGLCIKNFEFNIMTLGYPRKDDNERILKLEHKGVSIGYGNPDWGAEENKLYFVIKHGNLLNEA